MRVPFSFLTEQFSNPEPIFDSMRAFLKKCDFTLGAELERFESRYADFCGVKYAVGVGSGTDALALSLKVIGVGPGDEVITPPNSFIATTGAIVQAGARPVYVDCDDSLSLDIDRLEEALTPRTKAILPVHWAGGAANVVAIQEFCAAHGLEMVEDACQALGAEVAPGRRAGSIGRLAGFSTHPLKPLHAWGDGGLIVTQDQTLAERLRILRNHGMIDRDTIQEYGVNSRFDTLHAVVGNHVMDSLAETIDLRISHARRYDEAFMGARFAGGVKLPTRLPGGRHVFHLYQIFTRERDALVSYLNERGVEAKVHYPIPLHLQPAAKIWGYEAGQFPRAERQSRESLTLPCHQYLSVAQIDYTIDCIEGFFLGR